MRAGRMLVRLACLGGLLLVAPGVVLAQGVAVGEAVCVNCHRPGSGPAGPGCPQAALHGGGSSGGYGGYGGGSGDEALRQAARDLGSALGQALANELFGDPQREAREAAFRHQQALAEAARREAEAAARRLRAEQLREEWDERDLEHARTLASIFDAPRRRRPPRLGATTGPVVEEEVAMPALEPWTYTDTSVVDLRGTVGGRVSLPSFEADARVVSLFDEGVRRARDTAAFNRTFATYGVVPAIAGDSRLTAVVESARELAREFATDVGLDLVDRAGEVIGAPYDAAKKNGLIIGDVSAFLNQTAAGLPRGDYDDRTSDRVLVRAVGHVTDDDWVEVADALLRDRSAAGAALGERAKGAAAEQVGKLIVGD